MNFLKKVSSIILVCILLINFSSVNAKSNSIDSKDTLFNKADDLFRVKNKNDLDKLVDNLSYMDERELQKVITNCKNLSNSLKRSSSELSHSRIRKDYPKYLVYDQIGIVAWVAVAKIAKLAGLYCAGTLLENSVYGKNFNETSYYPKRSNGPFGKKIITTNVYKKMNKNSSGSSRFTMADNKDLFFAIHEFTYSPVYTYGHAVLIKDKFDFQKNKNFKNWLVNKINEFGYLNQSLGFLTPINVRIIAR